MVKSGQRRFLLNMGMSEETINQMTEKKAHNIISQEEKRRAEEREKEYLKAFYNKTTSVNCIICNCRIDLHQYELDDLSKQICEGCRGAILAMRKQLHT